ncbi:MAG: hypothetical protein ACLS69_05340 [Butyricicoccus sp.]
MPPRRMLQCQHADPLRFPEVGWEHEYMLAARALWSSAKPRHLGAVGQFRDRRPISCCRRCSCRFRRCHRQAALDSMQGMSRILMWCGG